MVPYIWLNQITESVHTCGAYLHLHLQQRANKALDDFVSLVLPDWACWESTIFTGNAGGSFQSFGNPLLCKRMHILIIITVSERLPSEGSK